MDVPSTSGKCLKTSTYSADIFIVTTYKSMDLVYQMNSVDGDTYQSQLPQPCVGQFGQIEMGWLIERWRPLAPPKWTRTIGNGE